MYNRIKKLSNFLNQEKINSSLYINSELLKKFETFKIWLIQNGAIFSKNIDFPYVFGPFNLIGCKSISEINENESILLIPKKLMILSKDLEYLDELIEDVVDELYESDDMPTIYLTLNLYLENKNKNSFFRPYLDLIFSNHNFLSDFTEENMKYFDDDEKMINSFRNIIDDLNELYDKIKESNFFNEITKEEFFFCYSQVISRQFYIDDNTSALIPLADLLNHNNINVHYEFYDSENYVFKYSNHFTITTDIDIDIKPTYIKEYPKINNNKTNEVTPFIIKDKGNKTNHEKDGDNKITLEIKETDYFSISTSKMVKIEKGKQVFNNYFSAGNKYLLKNYGFCLIDNKHDYTPIIFNIEKGKDIWLDKYLDILFGEKYKKNSDPFVNILKIKISFDKVCFYLIKYYRFLYFYKDKNDMKQYVNYKFDIDLEISFITLALECIKLKLNLLNNKNNNIETELNELENELFNNKENKIHPFKVNAFIYRITQKVNIINQIELLEFLLSIMNKYKNEIKTYNDILKYEKEFVAISQYDNDENSKEKIIKFINKAHKYTN